jgi:hypothetical protein
VIGIGAGDGGPVGGGAEDLRSRLDSGARDATRGGMVTETGIALVEQGEMVVSPRGSRAQVELATADAGTEVHIHLPVVVEVVGRAHDVELERTIDETLRRLRLAIEAQPLEG